MSRPIKNTLPVYLLNDIGQSQAQFGFVVNCMTGYKILVFIKPGGTFRTNHALSQLRKPDNGIVLFTIGKQKQ